MNYKHCSVIDQNGHYKTFVLVHLEDDGTTTKHIDSYNLLGGEQLLDSLPPASEFVRAKWNGSEWEEGASDQEIEAAVQERAQEMESIGQGQQMPSFEERLQAAEDAILMLALGGGTGV